MYVLHGKSPHPLSQILTSLHHATVLPGTLMFICEHQFKKKHVRIGLQLEQLSE